MTVGVACFMKALPSVLNDRPLGGEWTHGECYHLTEGRWNLPRKENTRYDFSKPPIIYEFSGHWSLPLVKHNVEFMCRISEFQKVICSGAGIQ
jgi:hypothetical protein